jgi:hypothetical protein
MCVQHAMFFYDQATAVDCEAHAQAVRLWQGMPAFTRGPVFTLDDVAVVER